MPFMAKYMPFTPEYMPFMAVTITLSSHSHKFTPNLDRNDSEKLHRLAIIDVR